MKFSAPIDHIRPASKLETRAILFFSSAGVLAYDTVPDYVSVSLKILLGTITFAVAVPSVIADTFPVSGLGLCLDVT